MAELLQGASPLLECLAGNLELADAHVIESAEGGQISVAYPYEAPGGHWSGGFLFGDTLLAQWTAECEVPFAYFVPARGGTPRLVTGERGLRDAPASIAHGLTTSGEAIIELIPDCNEAMPGRSESEIWLISPDGQKRRLGKDAGGWTQYAPLDQRKSSNGPTLAA